MGNNRTERYWFDPFTFANDISKGAIGFDHVLHQLAAANEYLPKIPAYPPYNVKKIDEEHYTIEMAVAGFGKHNLDIELKDGVLSITGNTETEEGDYLHKGIANRAFTRKFTIADTVEVKNAELTNGMLKIFLERFVPEEKKAKKIDIYDPFGVQEATKQLIDETGKTWGNIAQKVADAITPK
jgi:molecular chaperone IbpA